LIRGGGGVADPGKTARLSRRSDHPPCRNASTCRGATTPISRSNTARDVSVPHADPWNLTGSRSLTSRQPPQGHRPLMTRSNCPAPRPASRDQQLSRSPDSHCGANCSGSQSVPNHSPLRTVPTNQDARFGPWSVLPSGRASRSGKAGRFWSDRSGTGGTSRPAAAMSGRRGGESRRLDPRAARRCRGRRFRHTLCRSPPNGAMACPAVVGERNVGRV
jgi:hypothetical protein